VHGGNTPGPRAGGLQLGGDVEEVVLTQAAAGELNPDGEAVLVDAQRQGGSRLAGPVERLGEPTSGNSASMASPIEAGSSRLTT
jgi:hypothetical protein